MAFSDLLKAMAKGFAQGAKGSVKRQIRSSNNRIIQAGVRGWDAGADAQRNATNKLASKNKSPNR